MRLDVHTHGKLAKKLPFSTTYTDWLFGEARRAGLDALCLTEHFNTLQFGDLYRYLTAVSRRVGDCLELANGLRIFPGMETDVAEGGHILSIGPLEAILELNRRLEPHKEKETFLPLADLLDLLEQYPVLVGCAHPFRAPGRVPEQPMEQLRRFQDREDDPAKQWKITEDDWRNREKYPQYKAAIDDMFRLTSTTFAPWVVLESDDKRYARIKALRIIVEALEKRLGECPAS